MAPSRHIVIDRTRPCSEFEMGDSWSLTLRYRTKNLQHSLSSALNKNAYELERQANMPSTINKALFDKKSTRGCNDRKF